MPESKGERIAKVIAAAGICSRRDAERLIDEGRVRLNGNTLDTPATLVRPKDVIEVDGKKIKAPIADALPRLWLYHKPKFLVTTHRDEADRPTVFDNLPQGMPRVISIGRLDLNSEGLLLLTNSGTLSRALELPKHALKRTYRVRVNGMPTDKHLHMMSRGLTIDNVRYQPFHILVDNEKSGRNQWLTITITEGKNREIRRVFEHFKYPVSRLIRIGYGPFELGELKEGKVQEVAPRQVDILMKKLGIAE
jgi:23S rRNA pseudouridine2605 synthase